MQTFRAVLDQVLTALSGWLLLCAGLSILAAGVLLPTWRATESLRVQRDQMFEQAQWMQRQRETFSSVREAVVGGDPIILERLAFHHLRLKPENAQLVRVDEQVLQPGYPPSYGPITPVAHENALPGFSVLVESLETVDDWALEPMHPAPVATSPAEEPRTRLDRLTSGPTRLLTTGFGLVCLIGGLWFGARPSDAEQAN